MIALLARFLGGLAPFLPPCPFCRSPKCWEHPAHLQNMSISVSIRIRSSTPYRMQQKCRHRGVIHDGVLARPNNKQAAHAVTGVVGRRPHGNGVLNLLRILRRNPQHSRLGLVSVLDLMYCVMQAWFYAGVDGYCSSRSLGFSLALRVDRTLQPSPHSMLACPTNGGTRQGNNWKGNH